MLKTFQYKHQHTKCGPRHLNQWCNRLDPKMKYQELISYGCWYVFAKESSTLIYLSSTNLQIDLINLGMAPNNALQIPQCLI